MKKVRDLSWRNRPRFIDYWPKDVDVTMFIDESGDGYLKHLKKAIDNKKEVDRNNVFFNLTGCTIKKADFIPIRDNILTVKHKFWEQGLYNYPCHKGVEERRVCFHSSEIRGGKNAFDNKSIDRNELLNELNLLMSELPMEILSVGINKEELYRKYANKAYDPYNIALEFIVERFVKFILNNDEKGIMVVEARGKKEDRNLLDHIKNIVDHGTKYVSSQEIKRKIKGVYFNPKWCEKEMKMKSYFGLEIADLTSYPIFKFHRDSKGDRAFGIVEKKLHKYPYYYGKGYKQFP